jgi:hypothetical protein
MASRLSPSKICYSMMPENTLTVSVTKKRKPSSKLMKVGTTAMCISYVSTKHFKGFYCSSSSNSIYVTDNVKIV